MSHVNKHHSPVEDEKTIVNRVPTEPGTSTTVSVVRAVADAESVTPGELPVLAHVIDPELIDQLFNSDPAVGRSGVHLSFDYCGYAVEITDSFVTLRR